MAESGIYKITSPSGKMYIGQSSNINRRMTEHKYRAKSKNLKLYASLRKYGFENHKIEILFLSDSDYEKNRMESIYIRHYDSINVGLNHMDAFTHIGGFSGKKHTTENVLKIKNRMKGIKPVWAIDKVKIKVYCEHTKKTYDSLVECAKDLNISQAYASMQYTGKRNNKYGIY
jgi:group I intron endonuclease